jgi:hypothetical protein
VSWLTAKFVLSCAVPCLLPPAHVDTQLHRGVGEAVGTLLQMEALARCASWTSKNLTLVSHGVINHHLAGSSRQTSRRRSIIFAEAIRAVLHRRQFRGAPPVARVANVNGRRTRQRL